jgi:hypothetical protein
MRQCKWFSVLLVWMLLPIATRAQTGTTELTVVKSTFTGVKDVNYQESYSTGTLVTDEGNDWKYIGPGNPNWPRLGTAALGGESCLSMSLHSTDLSIVSDAKLNGTIRKVTVRAGGNLASISVITNETKALEASTTSSLQDYVFNLDSEEGRLYNDPVMVKFTLKEKSSVNPAYVKSVVIEYEAAPTYEGKTSTLIDFDTTTKTLKAQETDSDWLLEWPDDGTTAEVAGTTIDGERYVYMRLTGGTASYPMLTLTSAFNIKGKVKNIVVQARGDIRMLYYSNPYGANYMSEQATSTVTNFRDFVLDFGDGIQVDGPLSFNLYAGRNTWVRSIVVVMEEVEGGGEVLLTGKCGYSLNYEVTRLTYTVEKFDMTTQAWVTVPACKLTITGDGEMFDYNDYDSPTPWNDYLSDITEIELPEGIISIGSNAFALMNNANVKLPLPNSLIIIGERAFFNVMGWKDKDLRLPGRLEVIGASAFEYCSGFKNLYLPASVSYLGSLALNGIYRLENFYVDEANTTFKVEKNCIIEKATNTLIAANKNSVIPNGVVTIGENAFYQADVTDVVIPSSVQTVNSNAFASCSKLKTITVGSGVTSIGRYVFNATKNITDVYCYANPDNLTWSAGTTSGEKNSFKADKATLMHVLAADVDKWQEKFGFLNVTFVGDLVSTIEPIVEETTVTAEAVKDEDLTDNSVDNVYYNLDDTKGCGYDASQGCLVIGQATDMSKIGDGEPGSSDVRDNFNGMIVKVGPGKGVITLDVKSSGKIRLAVRIGNGTPAYAVRNERGNVSVSYNVAEETYVYIYAVSDGSLAPAFGRRTLAEGEDVLLIYGITVTPASSGNLPGDANVDGMVDVADVVAIVNKILEKPADNFNEQAADVNGDGVIDVSDVVGVVNIILGK